LGKHVSIIDSDVTDRIFHVPSGLGAIKLDIEDLTLTDGNVTIGNDSGGAIKSESGLLYTEDVIFIDNVVWGSETGANGGAIIAKNKLEVVNCLFENNYANCGGAIFITGIESDATIKKSLFLTNSAQYGGAIVNYGDVTIENTTFSKNESLDSGGGAISNHSTKTITFSTFVRNISGGSPVYARSGALYNTSSGTISVRSTILAGNSSTSPSYNNCNSLGTWHSSANNLEDDDTCPFGSSNLYNTDPKLAPLGNWGGPTQTYPLLLNSPAIDAGDFLNFPNEDQRSVSRPRDGNDDNITISDIGAFEADAKYRATYLPIVIK